MNFFSLLQWSRGLAGTVAFFGLVGFLNAQSVLNGPVEIPGVVRELEDVEVPARRDGVIQSLTVRRGHLVRENQQIASLDKTDTQLRLNVTEAELAEAQVRAASEGEVRSARTGVSRAQQELRLLNELGADAVFLEKFRMKNNLDKAQADLSTAENQRSQHQSQVDVKRNELAVLQNDIRQTAVLSPVTGLVRELLKNRGEWVQQGEPILVVTRMDRLLAEGFLDSRTTDINTVIGRSARIEINTGSRQIVFDGLVIKHSAPKLELDGKFPIWVEFENQLTDVAKGGKSWLVRPGMKVRLLIDPSQTVVASINR